MRREAAAIFILRHVLPRVAVAYVLIVCGMHWLNRHLVFHPQAELEATPAAANLPYEDVWLTAADGVKLHAWYIPADAGPAGEGARAADDPPRAVVLFCHGNAGNISHRLPTMTLHHGFGADVFIFDYRGYGRSEGRPDEEGTYRDAEAAFDWLIRGRGVPAGRIVVHGRSLGGAVAAHLATTRKPGGLIVEASFSDITDLGAEMFWWLPVRWLSRVGYKTAEYLEGVECPVMVIHSREDDMIPFHHGERNFAAANEPKRFLPIRGPHNGGFLLSSETYDPAVAGFLRDVLRDR